jgi:hypothetical protein
MALYTWLWDPFRTPIVLWSRFWLPTLHWSHSRSPTAAKQWLLEGGIFGSSEGDSVWVYIMGARIGLSQAPSLAPCSNYRTFNRYEPDILHWPNPEISLGFVFTSSYASLYSHPHRFLTQPGPGTQQNGPFLEHHYGPTDPYLLWLRFNNG